jgi:capsular exopolysaccharide synthesis family protein
VELREYVRALRRRWVWILVPVLLAGIAAAGLTLSRPPAYRSSMVLFLTTSATDPDSKASRLNSYIALLTGPRVAESVVDKLHLPLTTKQMQEKITAQVQDGTDLLVVSATDPDGQRSKDIVTTATAALIGLAKQLDPPQPQGGATGAPAPSVTIAQEAVTTRQPDNLARNLGFSIALGLLIGAAAVAVREATRRTVNEEADLRRLGIGTVGVIALGSRFGRGGHPDEELAEAFRRLRSLLPDVGGAPRNGARGVSLLLTGANPKEGTTAVACGLAIAMAETGSKVLLVDANMRAAGVDRYLPLDDDSPGLAGVLSGTADVRDVLQESLDGRLTVLPSGERPPDPGEILASPRLESTMRTLTERFDIVLVDTPSMQSVADAVVLSKVTDSALLVVRANHSRTADIERSIETLQKVGVRLAGAVLNALPRKLPTGAPWHRKVQVGASPDGELMAGLYGPGDTGFDADGRSEDADGQEAVMVPRAPVRGQARVVRATIVEDHDDEAGRPRPRAAARGQARVVVITDAKPSPEAPPAETTILPSQRTPETADHTPQNPDEEPQRRE